MQRQDRKKKKERVRETEGRGEGVEAERKKRLITERSSSLKSVRRKRGKHSFGISSSPHDLQLVAKCRVLRILLLFFFLLSPYFARSLVPSNFPSCSRTRSTFLFPAPSRLPCPDVRAVLACFIFPFFLELSASISAVGRLISRLVRACVIFLVPSHQLGISLERANERASIRPSVRACVRPFVRSAVHSSIRASERTSE